MPVSNPITPAQGIASSNSSSSRPLSPKRLRTKENFERSVSVYDNITLPKNASIEDVLRIGQQLQDQFHNLTGGGGVVKTFLSQFLLRTTPGTGKPRFSIILLR